jgi:hypothetical protein
MEDGNEQRLEEKRLRLGIESTYDERSFRAEVPRLGGERNNLI